MVLNTRIRMSKRKRGIFVMRVSPARCQDPHEQEGKQHLHDGGVRGVRRQDPHEHEVGHHLRDAGSMGHSTRVHTNKRKRGICT
eukprot:12646276-Alexandrium_andersonii.AAC.1